MSNLPRGRNARCLSPLLPPLSCIPLSPPAMSDLDEIMENSWVPLIPPRFALADSRLRSQPNGGREGFETCSWGGFDSSEQHETKAVRSVAPTPFGSLSANPQVKEASELRWITGLRPVQVHFTLLTVVHTSTSDLQSQPGPRGKPGGRREWGTKCPRAGG